MCVCKETVTVLCSSNLTIASFNLQRALYHINWLKKKQKPKLNSSNLKLTVWQLKYKLQSQKSYKTTLIFSSGIKLQYPEHERFLNSGKKKQAATDVNTIKSTHVRLKS